MARHALAAASDDPEERLQRRGLFLTVEEAAAELRLDTPTARDWLATHDLLRTVAHRELVLPEALIEAVRGGAQGPAARSTSDVRATTVWLTTSQAATRLGVDRGVLDAAAPIAATRCPHLVTVAGQGKTRRTYRWRADGLGEALALARAPDGASSPEASPRPRRRTHKAGRGSAPSLRALLRE